MKGGGRDRETEISRAAGEHLLVRSTVGEMSELRSFIVYYLCGVREKEKPE